MAPATDWPHRLRAAGIDATFAEVLLICLDSVGIPKGDQFHFLDAFLAKLTVEKPNPREVIRLCRKFIDRHIRQNARFYERASVALERWESALPV